MARHINKLTVFKVKNISKSGWHGDGGNLWLQVKDTGAKSWVFRYSLNGKAKVIGLGPIHTINLAEARDKARLMRQQLLEQIDPAAGRKAAKLATTKRVTFDEVAKLFITSKKHEWTNDKHAAQWESTLTTYASPVFGKVDVSEVDTALVMKCLNPIWTEKTETASRVRQRLEAVLNYATTAGYRHGDNPARWKGHIENLLPKASRVTKVRNHPSLPWRQVPAFMQALSTMQGNAARALEFAILTGTRSGEVRGATLAEIDLVNKVWTIPAERMKAGREHQVPLTQAAIDALNKAIRFDGDALAFPGTKKASPLSDMSLSACIKRLNEKADPRWTDEAGADIVPHGFRSSFRMWAAEASNFPREVAEHALAHQLPDRVEAAYQRGSQLAKRVKLMVSWAKWCNTSPTADNVLEMRRTA